MFTDQWNWLQRQKQKGSRPSSLMKIIAHCHFGPTLQVDVYNWCTCPQKWPCRPVFIICGKLPFVNTSLLSSLTRPTASMSGEETISGCSTEGGKSGECTRDRKYLLLRAVT